MTIPKVTATGSVRYTVLVNGVELSQHTQLYKAITKAQEAEFDDPSATTLIRSVQEYRVESAYNPEPPAAGNWAPFLMEIQYPDGQLGYFVEAASLFPVEYRSMPAGTEYRCVNPRVIALPGGLFDAQGEAFPLDFEIKTPTGEVTNVTIT